MKFYVILATAHGWTQMEARYGGGVTTFCTKADAFEQIRRTQAAGVRYEVVELTGRKVPFKLPDNE